MAFKSFIPLTLGGIRLDTATGRKIRFVMRERHSLTTPSYHFEWLFTKDQLSGLRTSLLKALVKIDKVSDWGFHDYIAWDEGGIRIDVYLNLVYMSAVIHPLPTTVRVLEARAILGIKDLVALCQAFDDITP